MHMKRLRHNFHKSTYLFCALVLGTVLLNLAAWKSRTFSDWYIETVFPFVTAPLSRLTSLVPFSVGEWLLLAAVLWVAFLLILLAILGVNFIYHKLRFNIKKTYPKWIRYFLRFSLWLGEGIFLIMTLNCFILYHATPIEEDLSGYGKKYTIAELGELRDYIVNQCNSLSQEMPRDASGEIVYEGGTDAMAQEAAYSVNALSLSASTNLNLANQDHTEEKLDIPSLSRLSGWQVTAKPLYFSDFVSQQNIQGYYFPFSMEANFNTQMKIMNQPFTMCHELSHTHGFIYEDEANLIGFLACVHSDDIIFQYSGYLGVLNYVNNSFYENVDYSTYASHPSISKQVKFDNEFLSDESWEEVEEDAVMPTETVKNATDVYLDTTLKVNGVESGKASYSHVVELLLQYYDGNYN